MRELDAAGIDDPALRASYLRCRELNAQYGRTYFLATRLLPPAKRPFVHALYGFARYADEIVDDLDAGLDAQQRRELLGDWSAQFRLDVARGESSDPIIPAVIDTITRWQIPLEHFDAFLHSMAMDLTVREYRTFDELSVYVHGSAAVIGLQMVPILEPTSPEAFEHARELGVAFQLANFIRDVGEDLERGRVYLPLDELAEFGVTRADLEQRVATPRIKAALAAQIARVRELEERSRSGITMLHPSSQDCIEAARILYCGIVDEIEAIDYEVFTRRASVPLRRRLAVALPALRRARRARREFGPGTVPPSVLR